MPSAIDPDSQWQNTRANLVQSQVAGSPRGLHAWGSIVGDQPKTLNPKPKHMGSQGGRGVLKWGPFEDSLFSGRDLRFRVQD